MKKSRVTIRDVARVARVTPQTVSRAIRNAPEVSAETREKVLKVAAELNYVKNNSASSLRCGNSKLIVIVYDHLVNIYFSIMIDYLQTCFREQNYSILMLSVTKHQLDRSDYEFALSHNVAGIVSFLEPDKEVTEMLDNFAIPVLLFGRRTDIKSVDYICMDDEEGGRLAARRFVEKGCTSSVYVSVGTASCAYDRFMGFKKELESAGAKTPRILDSMDCFEENFSALFENSWKKWESKMRRSSASTIYKRKCVSLNASFRWERISAPWRNGQSTSLFPVSKRAGDPAYRICSAYISTGIYFRKKLR